MPHTVFVPVMLLAVVAASAAAPRRDAVAGDHVRVVVSSADGVRRLAAEADLAVEAVRDVAEPVVRIDPEVRGQSILGLGASFDHASCENLARLTPERRREVVEALFHPTRGLGMNLMRVCIGTSDFTGVPYYTYDDLRDQNEISMHPFDDRHTLQEDNL
jgi:O-glycosyl hydrolase